MTAPEWIGADVGAMEALAIRLNGRRRGCDVRAHCPVHGGDNPTGLSLRAAQDAYSKTRIIAHCWTARCQDVLGYGAFASEIEALTGIRLSEPPRSTPGAAFQSSSVKTGAQLHPSPEKARKTNPRAKTESSHAQRLWSAGSPVPPNDPDHPARRWLASRQLWRPGFPLPEMVRWLPAKGKHTGAGSIMVMAAPCSSWVEAWPTPPTAQAVQLVALGLEGKPTLDRPEELGGLTKRTIGPSTGAVAIFGCPLAGHAQAPVRVAEGLADALVLAARFPGPAIATLGTAAFGSSALAGWLAEWPLGCVVHADADPDGQDAARKLRRAVLEREGICRAVLPSSGKDAADVARELELPPLSDAWLSYAQTLREMHEDWPRWEIARQSSILTLAEDC